MLQDKTVLTKREREILNILWKNGEPLIASDISKLSNGLTINTVQFALKGLLNKNLIEVADIVHSGTVLTRKYRATMSQIEFMKDDILHYFAEIDDHISPISIFSALLEDEKVSDEVLDELEQIIKEKKRLIKERSLK